MSAIQIPTNPTPPKRGDRVQAKDVASLWQAVKQLDAKITRRNQMINPRKPLPPLSITLVTQPTNPLEYEVYAQYGHVVPRHNAGGQLGVPIEIDDLPTQDEPLVVITNKKLWVELSIDVYGVCTDAVFDSGTTWPSDNPPQLIGGDDEYGTVGERYIRIAEIIVDEDTTEEDLIIDQLHTGHIYYAQPTLLENCGAPLETGEMGTLKAWNDTDGRWDLRSIVVEGSLGISISGCNIIITDCAP